MMGSSIKELTLVKEEERFVFRYESGAEEDLLDSFVDLANDQGNHFDWFDAAVLSFQLSKQLVEEADKYLCPQTHSTSSGLNSLDECDTE